jgi:hypothetical protein
MEEEQGLPPIILDAIPKAILKLTNEQSWHQNYSVKTGIELWLESSWRMAKDMGLSAEDYVEWMMLGEWNLAGSGDTLSLVSSYTALAGREAWALKKANISLDSAIEMAVTEGLQAVVDNAKIMSGLSKLQGQESSTEITSPKPPQPLSKDFTIDFPGDY